MGIEDILSDMLGYCDLLQQVQHSLCSFKFHDIPMK